jgi:hypothetical protein
MALSIIANKVATIPLVGSQRSTTIDLFINSVPLINIVLASPEVRPLCDRIPAKAFVEDIGSPEIIGTRSQIENLLVLMSGTRAGVHIGVDGHDGKRAAHCIARSFAETMAAINSKKLDDQKTVFTQLHQLLMTKSPSSTSQSVNEGDHSRSENCVDDQESHNTA